MPPTPSIFALRAAGVAASPKSRAGSAWPALRRPEPLRDRESSKCRSRHDHASVAKRPFEYDTTSTSALSGPDGSPPLTTVAPRVTLPARFVLQR
jgi:hypothetical protein